jgi:hypothetical protein
VDWLPVAKDFGIPVAMCVVLIVAIRYQNAQLQKASAALIAALSARTSTLEKITSAQAERITALEADRLKRADEYAHSLKDVAGRYAAAVREWHAWMEKAWAFLVDMASQRGDYHPTHAPAHPPMPPAPPPVAPATDRTTGRA